MELYSLPTGNIKLDGGAMFGIVPKVLWERMYKADENNLINCSMRCLLVVDGERKILFDSGIGDKQDEDFLRHYYLNGSDTLIGSLEKFGYSPEDITDHLITHLHFDHCGGSIKYNEDRTRLITTFPNAKYRISRKQWGLAKLPNRLESSSFLKENIEPIQDSGQLELFDEDFDLTPNICIREFHGHTFGLAVGIIKYGDKTIVNITDLIPTAGNIAMSWVSGYDTNPLTALEEKAEFLQESLEKGYIYFFFHDLERECCDLVEAPKGIRMGEVFSLDQVMN